MCDAGVVKGRWGWGGGGGSWKEGELLEGVE